ncbi:MAG: outer membrane beta-barrel protein [Gallionella sp.]
MKKVLLVALLLAPLVAHAEYECKSPQCDKGINEDGEFAQYSYIGIKGGTGQYKTPTSLGTSNSYGASFGHRYSKLFGVELDYANLGTYKDATSAGHSTAVGFSGVHFANLSNKFALIGRLGIARTNTVNLPARGTRNTNLTYGVGLDFQASCDISVRVQIDKYALKMPAQTTATNAYVGLNFIF